MLFPRYVDRPRLILKYEADELGYSFGIGLIVAMIILFATANDFYVVIAFAITVVIVYAIVVEAKKKTGLPGAMHYMLYAAGYKPNFSANKKVLAEKWPELGRLEHLDFCPNGFEDEFYS